MSKILIAEDDPISRKKLSHALTHGGYHVTEATNGTEAWDLLTQDQSPSLAILDWVMPGLDGLEICQSLRATYPSKVTYLMLLTAKSDREDIISGLEAGADDYIIKPFDNQELRARVQVGFRVLGLQLGLVSRVQELEQALAQIKQLQGLLPICCYCKKVREDGNYWKQVEQYVSEHSDLKFSHGICPQCYRTEMAPQLQSLRMDQQ